MEIPRSLLNELTEQVNALSASAQTLASAALENIFAEWDGADVAGLRVECIEALEAIEATYCDAYAAGAAAEFYDACRAAQSVRGAYSAIADSRRNPQALAGAVKAMVQYVVNGDVGRYRRECLSRIDSDVRRSANNCVAYNARKDPKKPKYARVPSGSETCGFCLMLASFGFHYNTEEAASHAHKNCDCRVVPSFGKASVAGYDATGMYGRYKDCLSTLGGRDGIRAEWDALPKEEREAYIASHGNKEGAAFQKYLNKRVSQEIETRDATWFQSKVVPKYELLDGANPNTSEKDTAKRLAESGWKSLFRPTRDKEMLKTSDVFFVSGSAEKPTKTQWEFKSPSGGGSQTLYHQLEEAAGQATRVVIDLKDANGMLDDEEFVVAKVQKLVSYTYKVSGGENDGEPWRYDQVMILFKDGGTRKITRH